MEKATPSTAERAARVALLGGVLAPCMLVAVILIVGQVTPGYDPISETISQAGTSDSRYAALQNSAIILYGLLMLGVAYGWYKRLGGAAATFMAVQGFGIILLAVFTDSPDYTGKPMSQDMMHNISSDIAFAGLMLGILAFWKVVRQDRALKTLATFGLVVFALDLLLPFVAFFEFLKPVSGLLQRLPVSGSFLWLALTSLALYRYPSSQVDRQIPTKRNVLV